MTKASLEQFIVSLDRASIRYLVAGDFAVAAHGVIPSGWELELLLPAAPNAFSIDSESLGRVKTRSLSRKEFDSAFARRLRLDLSPHTRIHICSYNHLVKSKRDTGRLADYADVDQLESVREERTNPTLANDPWSSCTFEGAKLSQLMDWSALAFSEKVARMEQMQAVSMSLLELRRKAGLRSVLPSGEVV